MPKFLISVHRPNGFDHAAALDDSVRRAIDDVNDAMVSAGVRVFVGGLRPPATARSVRLGPDGTRTVTDGAYLSADQYVDGVWVVEVPDLATALIWGQKASDACRAGVEVRPFY